MMFVVVIVFILLIYFLSAFLMDATSATNNISKVTLIKTLYLYLVSFVALMMIIFSVSDIISLGLRTYIFTKADADYYAPSCVDSPLQPGSGVPCPSKEQAKKESEDRLVAQRQRDAVKDISFLVVAIPLFVCHWRLARRKE
jgi:hypothetical protein